MIATAEKDWERAEKYFRQSIAFLSSAHQFHLAETYFEMALMYEHKGEKANTKESLNKSLSIFRKLGSREGIRKTKTKLRELLEITRQQ